MYKKSLRFATLLLFIFAFSSANLLSQNCNTLLKVEKDRSFQSADEDGAIFMMELTNQSASTQRYSISTEFMEVSCANKTLRTSSPNVVLSTSLVEANSRKTIGGEVNVMPGQTYQFQVLVNAPSSKDYDKWSCIKILANTQKCQEAASTILSVYLPDPSEQ